MKIWSYVLCWNEAKMLPYYLRHFEKFCEKMTFFDNGSTDGSQKIITDHPKAVLKHYDTKGQIRDDVYLQIKNNCWNEARGNADWVVVGDMDEFIYHPNLFKFLEKQGKENSIFQPAGFQMVSDSFPRAPRQIYEIVNKGTFHKGSSKLILFDPNRVKNIGYGPGCHGAPNKKFTGKLWRHQHHDEDPKKVPLKLLHYKFLSIDYVFSRYQLMARRLSAINRSHGWGFHYKKPRHWVQREFDKWKQKAQRIV